MFSSVKWVTALFTNDGDVAVVIFEIWYNIPKSGSEGTYHEIGSNDLHFNDLGE